MLDLKAFLPIYGRMSQFALNKEMNRLERQREMEKETIETQASNAVMRTNYGMYEMPTSKSYKRCLHEVQETTEFKSAFHAKAGEVKSLNDHSQTSLITLLLRE
jgi:hypothetical protein